MIKAKKARNDEFYTRYEDIEKELKHYPGAFKGKTVYCPCDDYRWSNFVRYFKDNFSALGLKRLYASNYDIGEGAWKYRYDGKVEIVVKCEGNGDFRSEECTRIKTACDIVVTNPPFSLFKEFIPWLYGKGFIIVGPRSATHYKDIFNGIKEDRFWLGASHPSSLTKPNGEIQRFGNVCWYANVPHDKRNTPLDLHKRYSNEYKEYDNYIAINVDRTRDIPADYDGVMGVPDTFLDRYCPEQFEIVGVASGSEEVAGDYYLGIIPTIKYDGGKARAYIGGKAVYSRVLIRRRTPLKKASENG